MIEQSIRLVKHHFNGDILIVGDRFKDYNHIPCGNSFINRGANVTDKLLKAANTCDKFVFMNDDFIINSVFKFSSHHKHHDKLVRRDGKASIEWNQAVDNCKAWLTHNGYDTNCYENHQPLLIESDKFIRLMNSIEWKHNAHFIKSLYCNVYPNTETLTIDNTKLIKPNIKKANLLYEFTGCFSIGQGFLNDRTTHYLKTLQ